MSIGFPLETEGARVGSPFQGSHSWGRRGFSARRSRRVYRASVPSHRFLPRNRPQIPRRRLALADLEALTQRITVPRTLRGLDRETTYSPSITDCARRASTGPSSRNPPSKRFSAHRVACSDASMWLPATRSPAHFPGAACVTALVDRLTHHVGIITIEGRSYRVREAEDRRSVEVWAEWAGPGGPGLAIDPGLRLHFGPQQVRVGRSNFGVFLT